MSKKTKWTLIGSSDPRSLLTYEEKVVYDKEKAKERKRMFKNTLAFAKMPVNKPKWGKKVKDTPEDME